MTLDPTAALLDSLHMRCVATHPITLEAGQSLVVEDHLPGCLCVTRGRLCIELQQESEVALQRAEILLFPRGLKQELHLKGCSAETGPTQFFFGQLRYAGLTLPPLVSLLPNVVPVRSHAGEAPYRQQMLEQIALEYRDGQPGATTVIKQLIALICLQVIRQQIRDLSHDGPNWMRGVRDPEIGAILSLMMQSPERPWTIQSLADSGQMARSTFARRFRQLVGEPPMDTLTGIRMRFAAQLLMSEQDLKDVARKVGYRSVSAFSVAFRRWSGCSPGQYRIDITASLESLAGEIAT